MLGNPVRSNPLGVVFPKPYFTTPPRPMYGWLTAHLRAVCPPFSLRTPPPISAMKPNRIDGKAGFICIATTAAELLPIGPLAYTQFGCVQVGIIGHLTKMLVLVIEHDMFGSNLNWKWSDTALSTVKSALRHLLECKPCVIEKALIASALSLAGKWTRCSYAAASAISGLRWASSSKFARITWRPLFMLEVVECLRPISEGGKP